MLRSHFRKSSAASTTYSIAEVSSQSNTLDLGGGTTSISNYPRSVSSSHGESDISKPNEKQFLPPTFGSLDQTPNETGLTGKSMRLRTSSFVSAGNWTATTLDPFGAEKRGGTGEGSVAFHGESISGTVAGGSGQNSSTSGRKGDGNIKRFLEKTTLKLFPPSIPGKGIEA